MTRIFLTKLPPEIPEHNGGVDLALFALRKVSGVAQSLVYDARGKPYVVGGRLIVEMANALAAEGWMPVFLCSPERVHFYTRLGFEKMGEYARYEVQ